MRRASHREPGPEGRVPRLQPVHGAVLCERTRGPRHQGGQEARARRENDIRAEP